MHFSVNFFLLFCDICSLGELLNASGLRKYKNLKFFWKYSFSGGLFWTERCFFFMESLRNQQILIFSHVHNIFSLTFCFYIWCVKKLPSCQQLILHFFKFFFFFKFRKKSSYWFIYEIIWNLIFLHYTRYPNLWTEL